MTDKSHDQRSKETRKAFEDALNAPQKPSEYKPPAPYEIEPGVVAGFVPEAE